LQAQFFGGVTVKGLAREFYSCVAVLPRGRNWDAEVTKLRRLWQSGTKVYIVTSCEDVFVQFDNAFHMEVYFACKVKLLYT